eukprot:jgi/Chrzof1/13548/Cz08g01190.t1
MQHTHGYLLLLCLATLHVWVAQGRVNYGQTESSARCPRKGSCPADCQPLTSTIPTCGPDGKVLPLELSPTNCLPSGGKKRSTGWVSVLFNGTCFRLAHKKSGPLLKSLPIACGTCPTIQYFVYHPALGNGTASTAPQHQACWSRHKEQCGICGPYLHQASGCYQHGMQTCQSVTHACSAYKYRGGVPHIQCEYNKTCCVGTCIGSDQCCSNVDCLAGRLSNTVPTCGADNTCTYPCEPDFKDCNGTCISASQCCSIADCPIGRPNSVPTCGTNNTCTYPCQPDVTDCNGTCISVSQCCSNTDCGSGRPHSVPTCETNKTCAYPCQQPDFTDCNGTCISGSAGQCCSNADCLSGRLNHTVPTCGANNTCTYPCGPDFTDCNGTCISASANQCCTNADCLSGRLNNTVPTCSANNTCTYPCQPDFKDCNGTCIPGNTTGRIFVIGVTDDDSAPIGYVAHQLDGQGSYYVTTDTTQALVVTIPACTSNFSISALNAPSPQFPFLGGIQGDTDPNIILGNLAEGSSASTYVGGTVETLVGSRPSEGGNTYNDIFPAPPNPARTIESGIWSNAAFLTPQWINTDGSKPATYIVYTEFDSLVLTGDVAAYGIQYSAGGSREVNFIFLEG